jgi:hypothetical protein
VNAPERVPMGLVRDMPAETYHSIQAMSAGGLKRMAQSPAHFYGLQLDPGRPTGGEVSPAMKNGTLVHTALFEPATVAARYIVRPEWVDGRTKDGKQWLADMASSGMEIVTGEQMTAALRQAEAVRRLPEIAALLSDGEPETSAFWIDDETGELCKCRPDFTSPAGDNGVILVDGKTCQDASPAGFGRAIWNFDYHLQAAWYSDGYELATGKRVHGFVFACVESAWPHAAAAYMLDDEVLERARAKNRALLNLYAECKRTNTWPGYPDRIQPITLPAWALKESA